MKRTSWILLIASLCFVLQCKTKRSRQEASQSLEQQQVTGSIPIEETATVDTREPPVLMTGDGESIVPIARTAYPSEDIEQPADAETPAPPPETDSADTTEASPSAPPNTETDANAAASTPKSSSDAAWIAGGVIGAGVATAVVGVLTYKFVRAARKDPGGPLGYLTRLSPGTYFKAFKFKNEMMVKYGSKSPYHTISGRTYSNFKYNQKSLTGEINLKGSNRPPFTYKGPPPLADSELNIFLGILPSKRVLNIIKEDSRFKNGDLATILKDKNPKLMDIAAVENHEIGSVASTLKKRQVDTEDNAPVPVDLVIRGVSYIDDALEKDMNIYVHCKSGVGRSATLVTAWYIKHFDMSATEAAAFVKERRPEVAIGPGREGHYHQRALEEYEITLKMKESNFKNEDYKNYGIKQGDARWKKIEAGVAELNRIEKALVDSKKNLQFHVNIHRVMSENPSELKNQYTDAYKPASSIDQTELARYLRSDTFNQNRDSVKVFHNGSLTSAGDVLGTVLQREPVNIGGLRTGSSVETSKSYFNTFQNSPWNAPFPVGIYSRSQMGTAKDLKNVGILHVPGLAFDVPGQVHFKKYVKDGTNKLKPGAISDIEKEYEVIADMVVQGYMNHAKSGPAERMLIGAYGANNFVKGLSSADQTTVREVIAETLVNKLVANANKIKMAGAKDIRLDIFNFLSASKATELRKNLDNAGLKSDAEFGRIPDTVRENDYIVNAWDPNSNVGNGNALDDSLDGWVGRSSTAAYDIHTSPMLLDTKNAYVNLSKI